MADSFGTWLHTGEQKPHSRPAVTGNGSRPCESQQVQCKQLPPEGDNKEGVELEVEALSSNKKKHQLADLLCVKK